MVLEILLRALQIEEEEELEDLMQILPSDTEEGQQNPQVEELLDRLCINKSNLHLLEEEFPEVALKI